MLPKGGEFTYIVKEKSRKNRTDTYTKVTDNYTKVQQVRRLD